MATSVHTKIEFFSSFFLSFLGQTWHCANALSLSVRYASTGRETTTAAAAVAVVVDTSRTTNTDQYTPHDHNRKKNAKRKKEKNTHTHTHTYKDRRILDHSLSLGIHTPRIIR